MADAEACRRCSQCTRYEGVAVGQPLDHGNVRADSAVVAAMA